MDTNKCPCSKPLTLRSLIYEHSNYARGPVAPRSHGLGGGRVNIHMRCSHRHTPCSIAEPLSLKNTTLYQRFHALPPVGKQVLGKTLFEGRYMQQSWTRNPRRMGLCTHRFLRGEGMRKEHAGHTLPHRMLTRSNLYYLLWDSTASETSTNR